MSTSFITTYFHQPIKTTGWCNCLHPKYTYVSCQIPPNASAKTTVFFFIFTENVEIFGYTSIHHFAMTFHFEIYLQITFKRVKKCRAKKQNQFAWFKSKYLVGLRIKKHFFCWSRKPENYWVNLNFTPFPSSVQKSQIFAQIYLWHKILSRPQKLNTPICSVISTL